MAVANKDLSVLRQVFIAQIEAGANNTAPIYRSPYNKSSYIKKISITNNTSSSGTFDIGVYENPYTPGGNLFVTAGSSVTSTAASTDGITWTTGTLGSAQNFQNVAYTNGIYLTVGNNTTMYSSTDGITWTTRTSPLNLTQTVAAGRGIFVVATANNASIYYSTDTATWTITTAPSSTVNISQTGATYGNGKFILTSNGTSALYSTDAITWSITTFPTADWWYSTKYGNGMYVSIAYNTANVATSTDAITWILRTTPAAQLWAELAYGAGTFLALVSGSVTAYSSTDGISWATRTLPTSGIPTITYGNGVFVLIFSGNGTSYTSTDGITWTARTLTIGATSSFQSVAYPEYSDFTTDSYLYKSVTLAANTTQSISYEIILNPGSEIRARSTVPMQITVLGES